jgi:hypothetical protein
MHSVAHEKEIVHQLTPRDIICLTWIAMQYAIRLDQLQRLLFRHTPEADRYKLKPGADRLSLDRTYEMIAKWLSWGYIEKGGILHHDKLWIWASREGMRACQLPFSSSGKPAPSRVPHLFFVNQVRLSIEEKRPGDLWISERQIRREAGAATKGEDLPHLPDATLTNMSTGKITALEIERSSKTEDELVNALRELAVSYKSVWYFASSATRRQVEARLEEFTPEMRKPFRIYSLIEHGGQAYGIS